MNTNTSPFNTADNTSTFCSQFKPLAANSGFHPTMNCNPFVPDMEKEFKPAAQLPIKPEFKSFQPNSMTSTPFTPVSPITPAQPMGQNNNMSTTVNPFSFAQSTGATFVPSAQAATQSASEQT